MGWWDLEHLVIPPGLEEIAEGPFQSEVVAEVKQCEGYHESSRCSRDTYEVAEDGETPCPKQARPPLSEVVGVQPRVKPRRSSYTGLYPQTV